MRVPAALIALSIAAPLMAASVDRKAPGASSASNCQRTTTHYAANGEYRGDRLVPRKLTELPSATPYMAVYRRIGNCEAPLTMVDYRNPRRR